MSHMVRCEINNFFGEDKIELVEAKNTKWKVYQFKFWKLFFAHYRLERILKNASTPAQNGEKLFKISILILIKVSINSTVMEVTK